MAEEGFNEQQRNLVPEDLNFSINDILNGSTDVNDSSFQSIVQTLSDNNHDPNITPSFANLPAELQDFFSASETDDLLSSQHNAHDLLFEPQPFIQPVRMQHSVPSPPVHAQPNVFPTTQQQSTAQAIATSPITLLDNLTSQLTPDKKEKFLQLFRNLQTSTISAAEFMNRAKTILGQEEYRQLEDLKSKPITQQLSEEDQRKRKLNATNHLVGNAPQVKRPKSEHIPVVNQPMYPPRMSQQSSPILPQQYAIQPNIVTPNIVKPPVPQPIFKTPAVPGSVPILQIPSKANAPTPNKPPVAPSSTPTGGGGGGGGDRVDYDTLTDVMGYAGVDLKEEAEHFMKEDMSGTVLPDGMDRSKFQDFMNPTMLRDKILKYAKGVNIKKIDGDFVSYLALATQDRVRTVMENMVRASRHRTQNPFKKPPEQAGHPIYKIHVKQRVKDQLEAIEKAESKGLKLVQEEGDEERDEGWYSKKSRKPLPSIENERKVTVQDAIFVMERDVQGGRGTNRRTLLKAYNTWSA